MEDASHVEVYPFAWNRGWPALGGIRINEFGTNY